METTEDCLSEKMIKFISIVIVSGFAHMYDELVSVLQLLLQPTTKHHHNFLQAKKKNRRYQNLIPTRGEHGMHSDDRKEVRNIQ